MPKMSTLNTADTPGRRYEEKVLKQEQEYEVPVSTENGKVLAVKAGCPKEKEKERQQWQEQNMSQQQPNLPEVERQMQG